jgi:guanine deaminase
MLSQIVRGPLLMPTGDGRVVYHADGALACDSLGVVRFAGEWAKLKSELPAETPPVRASEGVMLPPLVDIHTHIPQHPIRGKFGEGVPADAPGGRLLNALQRNVFPAEARCDGNSYTHEVVQKFLADTTAHGVVGGAAFMTPSAAATEIALAGLPEIWSVGIVMMNQNCPANLRTDEPNLEADVARLATRFGRRLIMTDRFAVAVATPLRVRSCALAGRFGLRTQTHLNEQLGEKELVETKLYPQRRSYTDVYRGDGLLDHECILAHCIHMRPEEWQIVADAGSAIAHCPTSNVMLGSGVMSLDTVVERQIPYAIATDVGASPTVSMLAEMGRFLQVHAGGSIHATPSEALWRATLGPAQILGLQDTMGRLEPGRPMSFIEIQPVQPVSATTADEIILSILPDDLDRPETTVNRVTLAGKTVFERSRCHA